MKSFTMQRATYENLQKQKQELENSLTKITEEVKIARERGDLRENAEYSAARASEYQIKTKLAQVGEKIRNAAIIDLEKIELKDHITFGCTVVLENIVTNDQVTYTILGEEEANIEEKKISFLSLLGKNLMGKKLGEAFSFSTPGGVKHFKVKEFFIKI